MQENNPYVQYMYSYPHKTAYRRLENVHLKDYLPKLARGKSSLYFHIPFCQYKCGYCNLFSVAGQSEQRMEEYVDTMERQAAQLARALPEGACFTELTLGGGTPLILPPPLLSRVITLAKKYFNCPPTAVETSPNQTTKEKLAMLKEAGVKRISIGVQSFHETELAALRRLHSADCAKKALDMIKETGFDCTNIDLIYGIPGQTQKSLADSLKQALAFSPEELFVYPLYVKPDTCLYQHGVKQSDDALPMYRYVRDILRDMGYYPHSMRRFSKKKVSESPCGFGRTISIGCGGRSYIDNLHFCAPYAVKQTRCLDILSDYIQQKDFLQVTHGYLLSPDEQKRRYVIRHLLFGLGIHKGDYESHFGEDVLRSFPELCDWAGDGYVSITEGRVSLTEEGFAWSDYLGPKLISEEVRRRMEGAGT